MRSKTLLPVLLSTSLLAATAALGAPARPVPPEPWDAFAGGESPAKLLAEGREAAWIVGEEIPGDERELAVAPGKVLYTWDGADYDLTGLDHTGLGGLDWTEGGLRDRLVVELDRAAVGTELEIRVHGAAGGLSAYSTRLTSARAGTVEIPFAAFSGGADLRAVGAVELEFRHQGRAPAVVSVGTASSFRILRERRMVVDSNGNGAPNRGDVVERSLTFVHRGRTPSAPLVWSEQPASRGRRLSAGAVKVSQGRVLAGNEAGASGVQAELGAITPGGRATLTWREKLLPRGPATMVDLVLQDGDMPAGGTGPVTSVNVPFTNGSGAVGFTGQLDNGGSSDGFVWLGTGLVHLNSTVATNTLSGAEAFSGVGDGGEFLFSPSIDGSDGVWTDLGELLREDVQAPGFPAGVTNTFNSRPTLLPGGEAYWISGFNETGGTSSEGRMLYTSPDRTPGSIAVVLRVDDLVGGVPIDRPSGIGFDYLISDDGSHHIHEILLDTGSTDDDGIVYLDGANIAQETMPTGDGDNWDNFDHVSVNNAGNHIFSGDTDGATTSDEFLAYNGTIVVREGDVLGGITLATTATVWGVGINNLEQAAVGWTTGGIEHLFFACDASDIPGTAQLVLSEGESVDVDGDGVGDANVTDFNTFGSSLFLAEDGRLFTEVDLDYGSGDVEAVIGLTLPSCGTGLVVNEVDYDQGGFDAEEFVEIYNAGAAGESLDGLGIALVDGAGGGATVYDTIVLPPVVLAPGDFFVVCGDMTMVPFCDMAAGGADAIQDGAPDAVALVAITLPPPPEDRGPTITAVLDTVSYEGDTGAPYTEGSGAGLEDDGTQAFFSISRVVDGGDTNQNNADFAGRCNSPGLPNFSDTTGCVMVPVELMSFDVD